MRLKRIAPSTNPVYVTCLDCGERRPHDLMFMDLDGAPFTAYYCEPCAMQYSIQSAFEPQDFTSTAKWP